MDDKHIVLEQAITQVVQFADGSRLKVIVEAPQGRSDDLASKVYYALFLDKLDRVELSIQQDNNQGGDDWLTIPFHHRLQRG